MTDVTCTSYDQIAGRFAELNESMPAPVLSAAQAFLERVGGDGLLLDLGCGSGRDLAWFEARGAQAIGADISSGMLAEARRRASCPLVQMDLRRLAFVPGSMAGIWCNAALLHVPKADAIPALQGIHRLLTPGGLLDLAVQQGSGQVYESGPFVDLANVIRYFARYVREEMREMLHWAGFRVLQEDAVTDHAKTWLHYLAERMP
jgi:SAM-dependent methyltransferase